MDFITREDILNLLNVSAETTVSIYLPTKSDRPEEYDKGRIHLKNLIRSAGEELELKGWKRPSIETLLAQASSFTEDNAFWRHQSEGLAIFIAMNFVKTVKVAFRVDPQVHVGQQFFVRPLLKLMTQAGHYQVLALSQNAVRLLNVNQHDVTAVDLGETPTSLAEALKYDDPEKRLQARGSGDGTMYHGHDPNDEQDSNLRRYIQQLDNGLSNHVEANTPIVLAAAEPLRSLFVNQSALSNVRPDTLNGNWDSSSDSELATAARKLIDSSSEQEIADAIERFQNLSGTEQTVTDIADIVKAAHFGQVDTLFVSNDTSVLGTYDEASGEAQQVNSAESNAADLIDLAITKTLEMGGTVYAVGNGRPAMTAILRFAIPE